MTVRVDPATIDRLAGVVQDSTGSLKGAAPAPGADAGPSTAAVAETVAELMRAAAGLTELTTKMADDLHANRSTYASTEDNNIGIFNQVQR
ncbi:hypothetical protein HUO13_02455 [Saccharopolyspora erythraea]|uniref:hypothetical protein n=1 Tax=Saccharopolyspora erythraea TaxID=1836 RepID=UPI001BAD32F5|nr:hypothetical protein [Saccharopolyspora erythraea]QUG99813.1 hypothetical protein HUO13_02455 [Saccharopolyspora erythraea]